MRVPALAAAVAALAGSSTGQCNYAADSCDYRGDGECDVGGVNGVCPAGSDCFDCEPCRNHATCGDCTSAGCAWCEKEQLCASSVVPQDYWQRAVFPKQLTCGQSDFRTTCPSSDAGNVFFDPAYPAQKWVYEMVKVEPVWRDGIRGGGILVQINDDGVDVTHPDFTGKFDSGAACAKYLPENNGEHGTVCAAIALGNANDACSVGIAPSARLTACAIIEVDGYDDLDTDAYLYKPGTPVHVSSNSWGVETCKKKTTRRSARVLQGCPFASVADTSPCRATQCSNWAAPSAACVEVVKTYCSGPYYEQEPVPCAEYLDLLLDGCRYDALSDQARGLLVQGVTSGRSGKGIVYVFAAGNGYQTGQDVNFEGWQNNRFTISVGSVGKQGLHASYSTVGAAVFMTAPGGDDEYVTNFVVAHPSGQCKDAGVGTSYAAPVVSGVVALILEANPALTWRDVQGVLASTAAMTDAADTDWFTNAALVKHSYKYGFGIVDAQAAVAAAKTWVPWLQEQQLSKSSAADLNLAIPDDNTAVTSELTVSDSEWGQKRVESVSVYLDLDHASRGDLQIVLTSAAGTPSLLTPGKRPESEQVAASWKLMTLRNWGETATGKWTLSIRDAKSGDSASCVDDGSFSVTRDGSTATCTTFNQAWCKDGAVTAEWDEAQWGSVATFTDARGRSPLQACCSCGGGQAPSAITDRLRSWRMVVYGREPGDSPSTPTPATATPTTPSPPTPAGTSCTPCSAQNASACPNCNGCTWDASSTVCRDTAPPTPIPVVTSGSADDDDSGVASKWYFWLIIGLLVCSLCIVVVILCVKSGKGGRYKAEAYKADASQKDLSQGLNREPDQTQAGLDETQRTPPPMPPSPGTEMYQSPPLPDAMNGYIAKDGDAPPMPMPQDGYGYDGYNPMDPHMHHHQHQHQHQHHHQHQHYQHPDQHYQHPEMYDGQYGSHHGSPHGSPYGAPPPGFGGHPGGQPALETSPPYVLQHAGYGYVDSNRTFQGQPHPAFNSPTHAPRPVFAPSVHANRPAYYSPSVSAKRFEGNGARPHGTPGAAHAPQPRVYI
eukprot:TRINITY_DN8252_c1_g1_i1.p1 TRINITY_DN8252_c1_g1~~TRINITY_DN8252_c1_g1_i1.p1  ORF type:complete len:1059 (+),score=205.76 TRINITY_DN8252_c1_g1_i1:35-3211(+)